MQLNLKITQDQSAALLAMRDGAARLLPRLARAWASGAQEVLGRAVKNRFSQQGPFPVEQNRLGVRSHRLRKSMRATEVQVDSSGRASISMGSNVSYFARHEFGFRGQQQVKGHTRRAVKGNSRRDFVDEYKTSRGKLTQKTSKALKGNYQRGRANFSYVRPHSRRLNIPARRPLGTELADVQTRLTFFKKFNLVISRFLKP